MSRCGWNLNQHAIAQHISIGDSFWRTHTAECEWIQSAEFIMHAYMMFLRHVSIYRNRFHLLSSFALSDYKVIEADWLTMENRVQKCFFNRYMLCNDLSMNQRRFGWQLSAFRWLHANHRSNIVDSSHCSYLLICCEMFHVSALFAPLCQQIISENFFLSFFAVPASHLFVLFTPSNVLFYVFCDCLDWISAQNENIFMAAAIWENSMIKILLKNFFY